MGVLQSVGTAKHPLSDKPGEGLLDRYTKMYDTVKELKPVVQDQSPVKQRPGADEKSQEPDSGFILDAAAEKEQLLLEKKQTACCLQLRKSCLQMWMPRRCQLV